MSRIKNRIFLRADGNSKMGLGHIFRLLAVAEMLQNEYLLTFVVRCSSQNILDQIKLKVESLIVLDDTISFSEEINYLKKDNNLEEAIFILDGYHFDDKYQKILKQSNVSLISIDDIYKTPFYSDVVINHAGGLNKDVYKIQDYTNLYLGPKYALVRNDFLLFSKNRTFPKNRRNVFICLGGADPKNDTLHVLTKYQKYSSYTKIYLVLGAAYMHKSSLMDFIKSSFLNIELLENLSAKEMIYYMSISEIAITPPSTISIEYMMIGGTLYLKQIADNQTDIKNYFINNNLALDFDNENLFEYQDILLNNQKAVFDGNSDIRIREIVNNLAMPIKH